MRMRLNLATYPLETHGLFLLVSGTAGFVLTASLVLLGIHARHVAKSQTAFRLRIDKDTREMTALTEERRRLDSFFSEPENAKLDDRAAFINSVMDARSFNWTLMFMDLEQILPAGVRVLNIEPKQINGNAAVVGDYKSVVTFLNALQRSSNYYVVEDLALAPDGSAQKGTGAVRVALHLKSFFRSVA